VRYYDKGMARISRVVVPGVRGGTFLELA
jgi:hypothetical protein